MSSEDQGNEPLPIQDEESKVPRAEPQDLAEISVPSSELIPLTSGETHDQALSPIRAERQAIPDQYNIYTDTGIDLALEDDEMLELQINLGDVQERNLKRKIEHKRRKAQASSFASSSGFNLTAELSMEMDREMARRHESEAAKVKAPKMTWHYSRHRPSENMKRKCLRRGQKCKLSWIRMLLLSNNALRRNLS